MDRELTTNQKGAIAEARVAAAALHLGIPVLRPMADQQRYDLAFDLYDRIWRVQCKWARRDGDVLNIRLAGCYHSPTRGYVRTVYSDTEIDAIAAYSEALERCYLIPVEEIAGLSQVQLRVAPSGNNQRAGIRWAEQYELGAVAQLGERPDGIRKARGSSPLSSTPSAGDTVVGAHEFRERFGWYQERAAAGEVINVTRRGRPYVVLGPAPGSQPALAA